MPEPHPEFNPTQERGFLKSESRSVWGRTDSLVKLFFGNSAALSIIILTLITLFLFKEGAGFISQYNQSLREHRQSGIEYVQLMRDRHESFQELARDLVEIRAAWIRQLKRDGIAPDGVGAALDNSQNDPLFEEYLRAANEARDFVNTRMKAATAIRDKWLTDANLSQTVSEIEARIARLSNPSTALQPEDRAAYLLLIRMQSQTPELDPVESEALMLQADLLEHKQHISPSDRANFIELLREQAAALSSIIEPRSADKAEDIVRSDFADYQAILLNLEATMRATIAAIDHAELERFNLKKRWHAFVEKNEAYFSSHAAHIETLESWNPREPIPAHQALLNFTTGREWLTASQQQDWFGLLPLLTGSLLISSIAILIAVPFGVGSAIYVNQIAGPKERNWLKPYIELVSAIPSVVIGFFGVIVFGEALRQLSNVSWLEWLPFFPMQERLNTFTAACLLALMAIPTIFTLAEEAINNIPRHLKEASFAMGATKLQTIFRIIVPGALSGIISATMLGFGRVIGETMVVLLCAGNRIKIPDFTSGLGMLFEPTHTMTGIIAQEMGEVVRGSLHYRALFMVGIVLFLVSLIINISAQRVLKKYSHPKL